MQVRWYRMAGLRVEVLRPATYKRLAQVLHQAAEAGRPYHVVHFNGHGIYLDPADLPHQDGDGGQAVPARGAGGNGRGGLPCRRCGMGSRWPGRCGTARTGT